MEFEKFDVLLPAVTEHLTHRRSLGLLGMASVAGLWRNEEANAKQKNKKKHRRRCSMVGYAFCVDGETVYVNSCGRKKLLERGEQPGRCPDDCVPQCTNCTGGDDGCGGKCSCPDGQVCLDATCEEAP